MKQSLEASKQGHALKRAQAEAERARVLEVIRSSNSNSNSNSNAGAGSGEHRERERGRSAGSAGGSRSPTKGLAVGVGLGTHGQGDVGMGAGHRRPVPSPPRSAVSSVFSASSAGSFDQVASARLGLGTHAQRRFGSPDADRFSSVSGVSGVSGVSSGSASVSSGSSQAKPSRQAGQQQQQQQMPYSAPPTHPDRRAGGSTTPRHALPQTHRRSPSYQSTTSTSAYTSRSQPSRSSPTGDRGGDDDSREEREGDGEGVWPWNGGSSGANVSGREGGNGKRTRPTRSQSMHQQSSPTTTSASGPFSPSLSSGALGTVTGRVSPPLPPPRRKTRPESVQLPNQSSISTSTPTRRGSAFGGDDAAVGSPFANAFESSGSSLFDKDKDRDRDKDKSASAAMPLSLSALQRSLSTLHARAQPVLDRARYKAEAGLSRRGFVPHAHNRLYDDERGEEEGVGHLVAHGTGGTAESEDTLGSVESMGDGTDVGVGVDRGGPGGVDFDESDGSERGGLGVSGRGRTGSGYAFGRERERERDSLKLPVEGEGWRPL